MLIPLLPFGQPYHSCPPKSMPELVRCISRCCWRAREVHRTAQPGACSCLHSGEWSTRCPLGHFQSTGRRATEADLPQLYSHGDAWPGCTLSVCGAGWPRGVRLLALPWAPRCPDLCQQPLPLRLGGCFVQSRVLEAFAWLWCRPSVVCQPALGGVQSPALCKYRAGIGSELLWMQMKWNTSYKWSKNKVPCTN